jgi:uncharacterized protein
VRILAQLQEMDLKIDSSCGEKSALLDEIGLLDERLEGVKLSIAGQNEELETVLEEKRILDENLSTETEAIARSEARLREIKTQKEYQAVSKEIASAKKVKAELEDQVLQKIERIEELKSAVEKTSEELSELETGISERKGEIQAKIDKIDSEIAVDREERDQAAKEVSQGMLKRYAMLREKRQGVAIAEAKGGSCLGCNMNLPPQLFNSLYNADNLVSCPHCQRLLYLRPESDTGPV